MRRVRRTDRSFWAAFFRQDVLALFLAAILAVAGLRDDGWLTGVVWRTTSSQELLMHDALADRSRVVYDPYTPEQQQGIRRQLEKFVAAQVGGGGSKPEQQRNDGRGCSK